MTTTRVRQRRPHRIVGGVTASLVAISFLAPWAFGQQAGTLDVQDTLRQILQTLQKQQTQIEELRAAIQQQADTIQAQQKIIDAQQQEISVQREQVDRAAAGGGLDAEVQYKVAMELQHIAIFDTRRREQPSYFRRVIGEFQKIVTEWPASRHAAEAQYRIGRIYHRYLKEYDTAVREYETLLRNYPDSDFVPEAQDALRDLRGR